MKVNVLPLIFIEPIIVFTEGYCLLFSAFSQGEFCRKQKEFFFSSFSLSNMISLNGTLYVFKMSDICQVQSGSENNNFLPNSLLTMIFVAIILCEIKDIGDNSNCL